MPPWTDTALFLSPLVYFGLLSLLAFAAGALPATHFVAGERAGARDGTGAAAPALRAGLALAFGMALLAQALFLFALAGGFGRLAMGVVAAAALAAGGVWIARGRRSPTSALGALRRRLVWALLGVAFAAPAWFALYPPVAWDDTIYHLPLARSLLDHGRYLFVDTIRTPVFPLLAETLFAPALLAGRSAAHGVSLVATLATALLLVAWGCDRFALGDRSRRAALWALAPVAIWIGQPIVAYYGGTSFVEPLLTMFATAAALAFERWREARETPAAEGGRASAWLLAAGAFSGWAAATKYLGLYLALALALAVGFAAARGVRFSAVARFVAAALVAGGPWYALIWALSGNPLFPFFSGIFGHGPWSAAANSTEPARLLIGWEGLKDLLRLGWDLVVDRSRVNFEPPASPLLVAVLPLVAFAGWRRPWTRPWIAVIAGFLVAFLALPRDARYLMFLSPVLSMLLVAALRDLVELLLPRARRLAAAAVLALVLASSLGGIAYAHWYSARAGLPPVGAAATDRILALHLPLYRVLLFRREAGLERQKVYALHGERLHDFGGPELLGDWTGPYRFELVMGLLGRPAELATQLRALGAEQLLLPRTRMAGELVEGIAASPHFRELYRDAEGILFAVTAGGSS